MAETAAPPRETAQAPPRPAPVTVLPSVREPARERRFGPLLAGRVLAVAGLFALLFVGFEVSVTGLAEQHAQASLLPAFRAAIATTTLDDPVATPVEGSAVALIQVPSLGIQQVVVEGTTPSDLKSGPGHLRGSPVPGEFGNSVVAGRRTTYGGPFGQLNRLRRGDVIRVATGQGYFTYRVRTVRRVGAGQPDPVVGTRDSRLTLITSDPPLVANGRLAVVAVLQGRPVGVPLRAPALVGATDLGLAGDSLGLGLGIIWGELLVAALWLAWRMRQRWPSAVLYLLAAPVVIALTVLTFTSVDMLLPSTL